MTTDRHLDRLIEAYLAPGVDELPDRSYAAVRTATERTRQRVGFGPWRAPDIRPRPRWVLVVAAVALLAVIALGPGAGGSRKPTATPAPSVPATPRPLPLANFSTSSPRVRLEAGTYVTGFGNWPGYHQIRFTVPDGWFSESWFTELPVVYNGPDDGGTTVVLEYKQFVDQVNADACHRSGQLWQPTTTAQQLIDELAHQPNMVVTVPHAVDLGGTPATVVEVSIPAEFDRRSCDGLRLTFLGSAATDLHEVPGAAGHRFWFYVTDTERPAIVVAHAFGDATPQDVAALQAVVSSIRFEP
jgi:hypothetical protein